MLKIIIVTLYLLLFVAGCEQNKPKGIDQIELARFYAENGTY